MSNGQISLTAALQKFLLNYEDARLLVASSLNGEELVSVSKDETITIDDKNIVSGLGPTLQMEAEQSKRLELGDIEHGLTWINGRILLQMKIGQIIVNMLLEETANLGLIDEQCQCLTQLIQLNNT